jgi:hypothetical protein
LDKKSQEKKGEVFKNLRELIQMAGEIAHLKEGSSSAAPM